MDPLAILKEFCVGGQLDQVVIEEDRIKFGDKYSFPKQSPTAFRAKVRCMACAVEHLSFQTVLLLQQLQPLRCRAIAAPGSTAAVRLATALCAAPTRRVCCVQPCSCKQLSCKPIAAMITLEGAAG